MGSKVSKEVDESYGGIEDYQVSYAVCWARAEAPACSRLLLSAHRESKDMRTQGDGTWLDSENSSKDSIYHLPLIDLKTKEDPQSERHHDCPSNCSYTRSRAARQWPVNNIIMLFYSSRKTVAVENASPCSLFLGTLGISVHLWAPSSDSSSQG